MGKWCQCTLLFSVMRCVSLLVPFFSAANIGSSSELEGTADGVLAQVNVAELTPIPELTMGR